MAGPYGQEMKKSNPEIYNYWMDHAKQHYQALQANMAGQQEMAAKAQLLKKTSVKSSAPFDRIIGEINNPQQQQNQNINPNGNGVQ